MQTNIIVLMYLQLKYKPKYRSCLNLEPNRRTDIAFNSDEYKILMYFTLLSINVSIQLKVYKYYMKAHDKNIIIYPIYLYRVNNIRI